MATTDEKNYRQPLAAADESAQPDTRNAGAEALPSALEQLRQNVHEDDSAPVGTLTLRKILGGDILSANLVRSQIWLFVLIVVFTFVYVAIRYQCQQDTIAINKLEHELIDAKYKALSSSSNLTEKSRQSRVIEMLRANQDSTLVASERPPFIINVPEE